VTKTNLPVAIDQKLASMCGVVNMTDTRHTTTKFAYVVLGIAVPVAAYLLWCGTGAFRFCSKKSRVDKAHDVTVEDSFPASDPPSAW
jgi:hypothetical protein